MKKELLKFKNIFPVSILAIVLAWAMILQVNILPANAQSTADSLLWGGQQNQVSNAIDLGNEDPRVVTARVINVFLGFLGIMAVVIILLAGFKWMMAGGNEDNIAEAKKLLSAGVIGLIVVLMSWALAKFIVDTLYTATTN